MTEERMMRADDAAQWVKRTSAVSLWMGIGIGSLLGWGFKTLMLTIAGSV